MLAGLKKWASNIFQLKAIITLPLALIGKGKYKKKQLPIL